MFTRETVQYICEKVFKNAMLLDVMYLVAQQNDGISKIDILREYQGAFDVAPGSQKFRFAVEESIATLVGTTFISSYREGTADKYFLTENGQAATEYMGEFLEKNPELLRSSKIMRGERV